MKFSHLLVLSSALAFTGAIAQQAGAPAADPGAVATAPVVIAETVPAKAGDPKAGQTKAGACAACHGLDGNSADPANPKLAGQHEQYIWRQLKLFKSGERENAIMLGMAVVLAEQDMRDIGAYFASQKIIAGVADEAVIARQAFGRAPNIAAAVRRLVVDGKTTVEEAVRIMRRDSAVDADL